MGVRRRLLLGLALGALLLACPLAPSAGGLAAGARATASVEPGGTGWNADASAVNDDVGQSFAYDCPGFGTSSSLWGTNVYTSDSSVCTAAVLEGRITLAAGGSVTIEVLAGRSSYAGSTRNGVTSGSYGSFGSSFSIVSATPASASVAEGETGWDGDASIYASYLGTRFVYGCPAGGTASSVWGTGVYTADSSVCTAAVLEGDITLAGGGTVTIEVRPGQPSYRGSSANGVTSESYGSFTASFVIVSSSRAVPAVSPGGSGWNTSPSASGGQTGERLLFLCPSYGNPSGIYGTGVYTDDSSACGAAALEGKITLAAGGTVTVEFRAGQTSYHGSTANGVTSVDYSSWPRSFAVVASSPATVGPAEGGTGWQVSASDYASFLGARFLFGCPAGGASGGVYGTGVYTSDSTVCGAAVLAGLITQAGGGIVTAEIRPGQSSYRGSTRNGVTSESYGAYSGSYVLVAAGTSAGAAAPPAATTPAAVSPALPVAVPPAPPAPPASLSPPLPAPVGGSTVDVATSSGSVLVNGRPLTAATPIRVGSTVNAAKGTITMTSASPSGALQTANFASGTFKVLQKGRAGITELSLAGGDFAVCKRKTAGAAATSPTVVRTLWGNGKGRFTTNGRYAAATVRGTIWLTEDRCDGTLILVKRGVVTVADHVHHRTVTVTAGHSYLA